MKGLWIAIRGVEKGFDEGREWQTVVYSHD
jgi:hypothetical protein